jgi:hypothetical protein
VGPEALLFLLICITVFRIRCSPVSIVTWLTAGRSGFDSRQGLGYFSLRHLIQTGSEAHQASYLMVPGALSLGVKRAGREADHSHTSSTEVKNAWSYIFTSPYVFMVSYLVPHRNNFTFIS